MRCHSLGDSGLSVSMLGLGSMTWGGDADESQAFAQLDLAVAHGINLIDTAELYPVPPCAQSYGRSEVIMGRWLKSRGKRSQVLLASKAAGSGIAWVRGGKGFERGLLRPALEGSLERMQTDYIDLYQLHWPQRRVPRFGVRNYQHGWASDSDYLAETLAELEVLRREGKIRAVGLSNETAWGLMRALQVGKELGLRVASVQNAYSLVHRRDEYHLSECLLREQVGFLAYSPLAGGLLSGKYRGGALPAGSRYASWGKERLTRYLNLGVEQAVEAYGQLADEFALEMAEMVLAFTCAQPFISSTLVGASSIAQLRSALRAAELQLPDELKKKIESCYRKHPDPAC